MSMLKEVQILAKPKQNTEKVSVFLDQETLKELKEEALKKGINVSALIRMIILDRINK